MVFAIAVAGADVVLADANRRHYALTLAYIDDAHAARGATGDADSFYRTADQGSAIGHQHDLIACPHRERGHDLAALGQAHQFHTLAAAAGHPIFVGRTALAESRRCDREDEFLPGLQLAEALRQERGCSRRRLLFGGGCRLFLDAFALVLRHAKRARLPQIGVAFVAADAL